MAAEEQIEKVHSCHSLIVGCWTHRICCRFALHLLLLFKRFFALFSQDMVNTQESIKLVKPACLFSGETKKNGSPATVEN
ncbi:hypothetical protein LEMLEM_LOCUS6178 [Lemmus lemmus]